MRPLDGVTILDLTRLLPGPAATRLLEAYGAEVICVHAPGGPDDLVSRGRRRALDLKSSPDRNAFLEMTETADVLVEGFRPGVMRRLALGFDALHARNPRLIYVSLSGYGQSGPNAGAAGHDINYMAAAGFFDLNGSPPVVPAVQIADLAGGSMQTVIGVLLALAARTKTGRGQHV
ncbi:MAG: CoA transferase, partial [Bryobacteraceae bacterium]